MARASLCMHTSRLLHRSASNFFRFDDDAAGIYPTDSTTMVLILFIFTLSNKGLSFEC